MKNLKSQKNCIKNGLLLLIIAMLLICSTLNINAADMKGVGRYYANKKILNATFNGITKSNSNSIFVVKETSIANAINSIGACNTIGKPSSETTKGYMKSGTEIGLKVYNGNGTDKEKKFVWVMYYSFHKGYLSNFSDKTIKINRTLNYIREGEYKHAQNSDFNWGLKEQDYKDYISTAKTYYNNNKNKTGKLGQYFKCWKWVNYNSNYQNFLTCKQLDAPDPSGKLRISISKESTSTYSDILTNEYTFSGIKYQLYGSQKQPIVRDGAYVYFTLDENGNSNTYTTKEKNFKTNTTSFKYYVKEISTNSFFKLNTANNGLIGPLTFTKNNKNQTFIVADDPAMATLKINKKLDPSGYTEENGKSLAGFKFTITYLDPVSAEEFRDEAEEDIPDEGEVESVKVTLDMGGHAFNDEFPQDKNTDLAKPEDPVPVDSNYTFKGWFETPDCAGNEIEFPIKNIQNDITLYAKWEYKGEEPQEEDLVNVTLDLKGQGNSRTVKIKKGNSLDSAITPSTTGYIFVDWYADEALENKVSFPTDPINEDITLYAKWDVDMEDETNYVGDQEILVEGSNMAFEGITDDNGEIVEWTGIKPDTIKNKKYKEIPAGNYVISENTGTTQFLNDKCKCITKNNDIITIKPNDNILKEWVNKFPIEYSLQVKKVCADGGSPDGFGFKIKGPSFPDGQIVKTEENGMTRTIRRGSDGLPLQEGTYTIEEVLTSEQAKRYKQPEIQTVVLERVENEDAIVEFVNNVKTYNAIFAKKSTDNKIKGIDFKIVGTELNGNKVKKEIKSDENGIIKVNDLAAGNYVIEETGFDKKKYINYAKVEGYKKPAIDFNITGEEDVETIDFTKIKGCDFINIRIPEIKTVLLGDNGEHKIANDDKVVATDTIKMKNLEKGKKYTVSGELMDANTGKPTGIKGSTTFTAKKSDDVTKVKFNVDTTQYANHNLVAYETLSQNDKTIAEHKDLKNKDQTIQVGDPPKTGDGSNIFHYLTIIGLLLMSMVSLHDQYKNPLTSWNKRK